MTIENRELVPGTKLEGSYKKATYTCQVVSTSEGEIRFYLEDGRLFSSPSAAAKAVMNGISANGWRFWSLAGDAESGRGGTMPPRQRTTVNPTPSKSRRQIKKLPNQREVEEGKVRWFCSACMKSFLVPEREQPATCPEGHPAEADEELVPTSS